MKSSLVRTSLASHLLACSRLVTEESSTRSTPSLAAGSITFCAPSWKLRLMNVLMMVVGMMSCWDCCSFG